MKRITILLIAVLMVGTAAAQQLAKLTGMPVPRRSAEPIKGAIVTLIDEWDKDVKYMRKVDGAGFEIIVPQGSYLMKIEAEGYETYRQEIDIDAPHIDLDLIKMRTTEEAAARDAKRKKRASNRNW